MAVRCLAVTIGCTVRLTTGFSRSGSADAWEGAARDGEARAFWLAEPAAARSGRCRCRAPEPGEVLVRTLRSGVSRGTETLVFRGGVPPSQYATMRAPFQEGDFPGPVKYGYLNVGVVEDGPARAARPHRLLPLPAPDRVRRAGRPRSPSCPTACRPRARCSPAPSRPRSTRCGTPRRCVGDRVAVVGAGMVGCCVARLLARHPRRRGRRWSTSTRPRGRRGGARRRRSRARTTRRAAATWSCTPARPRPGCSCRSTCSAPEGTVLDLSWYGDRPVDACARRRRSTPGRLTIRASQVGDGVAGPARPAYARRPAGARARPAARPGLRRAAHRARRRSTSCPT